MKNLFFIFLLICNTAVAQSFTFNRVSSENVVVKLSGEITVTDSTISIKTDGFPESILNVSTVTKAGNYAQYLVNFPEGSMYEVRMSITNPVQDNLRIGFKKNETGTLYYEHKDLFANTMMTSIYYLIPKN